jgi:hypothetical protein
MRYIPITVLMVCCAGIASAQTVQSTFKTITDIAVPPLKVPTVIEIPFTGVRGSEYASVAIERAGQTNGLFEPLQFQYGNIQKRILEVEVENALRSALTDGVSSTFHDFEVASQPTNTTIVIDVTTAQMINGVQLSFAEFSARPKKVQISAANEYGGESQMLFSIPYTSDTINFPERRVQSVFVTLTYDQPLRITDIALLPNEPVQEVTHIRFLAQPGAIYRMYSNPERYISVPTSEMPNLAGGTVRVATTKNTTANQNFVPSDLDKDGASDSIDNCPQVSNADQTDIDSNGIGDACDDFDRDGYVNVRDNCPLITNADQRDTDGDNIGDVCDEEESRFSEQYPWLPWMGMGLVLILLVAMTTAMMRQRPTPPQQ